MHQRLVSAILLSSVFLLASCRPEQDKRKFTIHRGFYHWKSVFNQTGFGQTLQEAKVELLYIKFFDVDWNYATHEPFPLAQVQFTDKPDSLLQIIPVVFITNRCLDQIDSSAIPLLAARVATLLKEISGVHTVRAIREIQVDCDWTDKTRSKYFYLLTQLRGSPFFSGKQLSATIRLHQAKYHKRTGIPPVDKGLLMAYNMGNLKDPRTSNSILDPAELTKYIQDLENYPLPLDLALPLFSWYVWFNSGETYKGLIHDYDLASPAGLPVEQTAGNNFVFNRDCDTLGFTFRKGDRLRKEESNFDDIIKSGEILARHWRGDSLALACFHLDSVILKKYPPDALEKIFGCLND